MAAKVKSKARLSVKISAASKIKKTDSDKRSSSATTSRLKLKSNGVFSADLKLESKLNAKAHSNSILKSNAKSKTKLKILEPIDWKTFLPDYVIGVDEVGRGCLAGPVYAAAVSFRSDNLQSLVTDSKLLSEARREELAALILAEHEVGIGFATVEEIDEINILNASLLAMKRAVLKLKVSGAHILIDGNKRIPGLDAHKQTTIIQGDLRVAPISAASIVAKVTRDRLMKELGLKYPQYGFEVHKGYSTPQHKNTILQAGPCVHHRRTFAGVKEHLERLLLG